MFISKHINHISLDDIFKIYFSLIASFYYLMFTNPKNYFLISSILCSSKIPLSFYINKLHYISKNINYSHLYNIENIPYITISIYNHQQKKEENLKLKKDASDLFNWSKKFSERFNN